MRLSRLQNKDAWARHGHPGDLCLWHAMAAGPCPWRPSWTRSPRRAPPGPPACPPSRSTGRPASGRTRPAGPGVCGQRSGRGRCAPPLVPPPVTTNRKTSGAALWLSPALPGRCHDLTAARAHRIIRICERQGVPILADRAYIGAGPWVTTPARRPAGGELTLTQQTINRALSRARAPVERGVARLKSWRIFRRARCSPNRMSSIAAAVLTLERQR